MMRIGSLAKRAGVGIDTVRYYEREGLLPRAQRMASGYRMYGAEDVRRLLFIRRAKALGFSLPEIRELLALSSREDGDTAAIQAVAREKLSDVEARIAELVRIRDGLKALIDAGDERSAPAHCPILDAIAEATP